MASYTPNYGLKKPADADTYDIADANGNMDLIDTALHSQNEAITNLNNRFTTLVSPDLNNMKTSGLYYAQGATHSPGGSSNWWGSVTVIANSGQNEVKQIFYDNSSGATYTRFFRNSAWGDWQEFAIKGETAQTIKIADYENTGTKTISVSSSTLGGAGTFLLAVQSVNALYRYVGMLTVANTFFVDSVSGTGIIVTGERTGSSQGNITITPSSNYGNFQIQVYATRLSYT